MDTKYRRRDLAIFSMGVTVGSQYEKARSQRELLFAVSHLTRTKLSEQTSLSHDPVELINILLAPRLKDWNTRLDPEDLLTAVAESGRPIFAKNDKLDLELAAFDSLQKAGELVPHLHQYVAIHQGRVFDSDDEEFRLAARVASTARREGAIAVCHVTTPQLQEERELTEPDLSQFESPVAEGFPDEV